MRENALLKERQDELERENRILKQSEAKARSASVILETQLKTQTDLAINQTDLISKHNDEINELTLELSEARKREVATSNQAVHQKAQTPAPARIDHMSKEAISYFGKAGEAFLMVDLQSWVVLIRKDTQVENSKKHWNADCRDELSRHKINSSETWGKAGV